MLIGATNMKRSARMWKRLIAPAVLGVLLFHTAGAAAQTETNTKTYKSSNGAYALKVEETTTISGRDSIGAFRQVSSETTVATGLTTLPDGTASGQWQWSKGTFPVAGALVADSGKLFILITSWGSGEAPPPPSRARNAAVILQVVILDDKGKSHAVVSLDDWWKALGPDGKMSPDNPPELRFLENEKILEIKLASGKVARVNTNSGELTVQKGAATVSAPAPATAPGTSLRIIPGLGGP